jgi:hypothetical protein
MWVTHSVSDHRGSVVGVGGCTLQAPGLGPAPLVSCWAWQLQLGLLVPWLWLVAFSFSKRTSSQLICFSTRIACSREIVVMTKDLHNKPQERGVWTGSTLCSGNLLQRNLGQTEATSGERLWAGDCADLPVCMGTRARVSHPSWCVGTWARMSLGSHRRESFQGSCNVLALHPTIFLAHWTQSVTCHWHLWQSCQHVNRCLGEIVTNHKIESQITDIRQSWWMIDTGI